MDILFARRLHFGGKMHNAPDAIPTRVPGIRTNSIFLAGPTPRSEGVPSWRPDALAYLKGMGFAGTVFVPEDPWDQPNPFRHPEQFPGVKKAELKAAQNQWEWWALAQAECVVFWIPRDMATLPGLTTNVEAGLLLALRPERLVFGAPLHADSTSYLRQLTHQLDTFYKLFGCPIAPRVEFFNTLEATIGNAIAKTTSIDD